MIKARDGRRVPISSRMRGAPALWNLLGNQGKRSIVLNVPGTYPPESFDGFMVSGFMTPKFSKTYANDSNLLSAIERKHGPYRLHIKEAYSPGRVSILIKELLDDLAYKQQVCLDLMHSQPWDCFVYHIWTLDRVQHELWHVLDQDHPLHTKEETTRYKKDVVGVYRHIDNAIRQISQQLGKHDYLFIVSDHGFSPIHQYFHMNTWLLKKGYLALKRNPITRLKHWLFSRGCTPSSLYRLLLKHNLARLRFMSGLRSRGIIAQILNKIFLSLNDMDKQKSLAYSQGNFGQIYFTAPEGVRNKEHARLKQDLLAIQEPGHEHALFSRLMTKEDDLAGPFTSYLPDVMGVPSSWRNKPLGTLDFISHHIFEAVYGNSGDHSDQGMYLLHGPGISAGAQKTYSLLDALPTILHLLGQQVPNDLNGTLMKQLLSPDLLEQRPIKYTKASNKGYPTTETGKNDPSSRDRQHIEEQLRSLGYM